MSKTVDYYFAAQSPWTYLGHARLADSRSQTVHDQYAANTEAAIAAGVFGAPSYCIDGEIFWGQDRLDFVARKLGQH